MLAKHALSQLSYGPSLRRRSSSRQLGAAFAASKACGLAFPIGKVRAAGLQRADFYGAKRRKAERPPRLTAR
jgi:hypothetical protein